ncbi:MAG: S41 family peptidase [Verrucomicrobiales bacterium]
MAWFGDDFQKRALLKARFFLALWLWCGLAAGQEEDAGGRSETFARHLWEEFVTVYQEQALRRYERGEIEEQALALLKEDPAYRIYRSRLDELALLEALRELAKLRKVSMYEQVESLMGRFCEAQSPLEAYLSEANQSLLVEMSRGERAGAGMQLNRDASGRYTLSPFAGSPAEQAGVKEGDELIEVEGKATLRMAIPEIKALVLGPIGSELSIRVRRRSGGEEVLRIERGRHREPLARLEKQLTGHVLRVRSFAPGSFEAVRAALAEVPDGGRLVLDLRGNGGGELGEAVRVASLFLPDGVAIYRQQARDGEIRLVRDEDGRQRQFSSIVLQVDRFTASGAELVTAALLSQRGVSVQGEKTYGKSVIQSEFKLQHGGLLTLVTDGMSGPGGEAWSEGIDPAKWARGEKAY